MRSLLAFIFVSVLLHLSTYTGLRVFVPASFGNHVADVTEIEIVEDSDLEKIDPESKPVIKQLDAENSLDASDEARFSSEKTQRVKVETKAAQIGESRNSQPASQEQNKFPQENKAEVSSPEDEIPEFARSVSSNPNQALPSAIGYDLPTDIQISNTTNLNTDANIYYSFYERIEQLVRVRWTERLDYYWSRISLDFKKENLYGRVFSTTFEVTIKGTGEYHSATILRSSGYKPFDEAAIYSFKNAGYFPNVPKAKVQADGLVRLKYRFSLHIGP